MADSEVDLSTLSAVKAHLAAAGVTAPTDQVLDFLITAASARIQTHLARRIPSQTYTTRLNGRGEVAIFVPNTPITAVLALRISGVDVPAAADGHSRGYIIDANAIYLRGYFAERGVMNVELTYTGGYATIPADLVRACHEAIAAGLTAWSTGAPAGAVKVQAGNHMIQFGDIAAVVDLCLTGDITSMLRGYRRVVPC